jgi:succinyl-CoA synthetase alpha subunit
MAFLVNKHSGDRTDAAAELRIGALPGERQRGRIGIVSGSAVLAAFAARQLAAFGLGASQVVRPAEDHRAPSQLEQLQRFDADPGTDAVLLIGALDPEGLDDCTAWIVDHMHKPLVGFIDEADPAHGQRERLQACGVHLARDARLMGELVASLVEPSWLPFD